jgi:RHS repeat-associated protein
VRRLLIVVPSPSFALLAYFRSKFNRSLAWLLAITTVLVSFSGGVSAQSVPGVQMFSTNEYGVDLATGNINLSIPVRSKVGKIPFWSKITGTSGMTVGPNGQWSSMLAPIYQDPTGAQFSYGVFSGPTSCSYGGKQYLTEIVWQAAIVDFTGASHSFGTVTPKWLIGSGPAGSSCGNAQGTLGPYTAIDGSGYTMIITNGNPTVYDRSGNYRAGTCSESVGCGFARSYYDPDGVSISSNCQSVTDSLATTVMTVVPCNQYLWPSGTISYLDVNNDTQSYTATFTNSNVATTFNCIDTGGVQFPVDYTGSAELLTTLTLPDGGKYMFSYEPTPGKSGYYTGRIAKITFPTGGSVSYSYSGGNNGINCTYHTIPTLTVTVNDGNGNVGTYTYASSLSIAATASNNSLLGNFNVTRTDPAGNQAVYSFSGEFLTQRLVYQGAATGTPLLSALTCYNNNFTNCVSPATVPVLPITQTDTYTTYNTGPQNLVESKYDTYGNETTKKEYDWGQVNTRNTYTTYGSWNGSSCGAIGNSINDHPCSVVIQDAAANTLAAAYYTYSGAGHTTTTKKLVSGSNYLVSTASYNQNGTLASVTDANTAITNYYYNGTGGCNNVLITSTSYPVGGISTSQHWNCSGGVLASSTDANGKTAQYGYVNQQGTADPYWRLLSTTDPLSNVTWNTYSSGTTIPPTQETSLVFNNGSSTVDVFTTLDGLGRGILSQTRQAPNSSTFDTVQYTYNSSGNLAKVSMPCAASAGVGCSTPVTSYQYDALNRTTLVTDGGGGTQSSTYSNQDVVETTGPAPINENAKSRQLEYDGLGRLTSVCEITSASGAGSCAQASPTTGYWTKYAYDTTVVNSLVYQRTTVTQNAQSTPVQTRTYLYDGLDRLSSATNPEWGPATANYTYDVACTTTPASAGDLTKRVDAAGNVTCFAYDGLHRLTDVGLTGPTCRHFRYDASVTPPTGVTVATTLSRMEEAYTDNCASGKITDEWFGYDALGNVTDLYESTPHSSGFYHTTAQYFPNGAVQSVSGVPGQSTWNFGVEGEGRPSSAVTGSTTWVSSVAYNLTSNPPTTTITYGSGDIDTYTFDASTGRMTNSTFTIGSPSKSYINGLSWNSNGSLQQLATTDPFNSTNALTCSYLYDDLGRIGLKPGLAPPTYYADNCGTGHWQQNFTYDAFGNITKSGSSQWQPGYNQSTNRIQLSGSTYDGNGNLTNDVAHTYAWDPNFQNPSAIDGVSLSYDALNRMVEQNASGTYTQILYSPIGKVGTFNGQTAKKASIPLPGGAIALFVPGYSGLIAHKDWLGSTRLISNRSTRASWGDYAYAPFGESSYTNGSSSGLNFTGQTQDTSTGLYDFQYREYSPVQGRWVSPDAAGLLAVDFANPQSWNRYAYVLNNPLSATDPSGFWCVWDDGTGHDADPKDGGASEGDCTEQGGHWDKYDTITGVWSVNGYVTQISYTTNGQDQYYYQPYGMSLEGLDSTLEGYSKEGYDPLSQLNSNFSFSSLDLHITFPDNHGGPKGPMTAGQIYSCTIVPDATNDINKLGARMKAMAENQPTDEGHPEAPEGVLLPNNKRSAQAKKSAGQVASRSIPAENENGASIGVAAAYASQHLAESAECFATNRDPH